MIYERDVRSKIAALLRDQISYVEFARWIVDQSWNMHRDSSSAAVDLVSDIHLLVAERNDLSLDDIAFRHELSSLLNNIVVSAPVDVPQRSAAALPRFVNSVPVFRPAFHLALA